MPRINRMYICPHCKTQYGGTERGPYCPECGKSFSPQDIKEARKLLVRFRKDYKKKHLEEMS